MNRIIIGTTALLASACAADQATLVQEGLTYSAQVASVWQASPTIHPIAGARALASDGATVLLLDPRLPEPLDLLLPAQTVTGGAWLGEQVLVSTDQGVYSWDGRVWSSPLTEALGGAPSSMEYDGRALWIELDGTLQRLQDGRMANITVGGEAPLGPRLLGATLDDLPVTWVSVVTGDSVGATAIADDGELVEHLYAPEVRSIGADASGHTWIADGRVLHDRAPDGVWTIWRFDTAVANVAAHPGSDRLWVQTVGATYAGTSTSLGLVSQVPEGRWMSSDNLGRLLVQSPDGVRSVSIDRPIALLDLPSAPLVDRVTVSLDISQPQSVTSVIYTMDGDVVPAEDLSLNSVQVNPALLTKGAHELQATVSWDDGEVRDTTQSFVVGSGLVTWNDHIEPLFEDRCALCHDGASETKLDKVEVWRERFDDIWEQVEPGGMPLGKDPLTVEQLDLIQSWKAGGFLVGDE